MKLRDSISLLTLLLLNIVLKILFLSTTSIGGDEPFSIYHAQMNVPDIIHHLLTGNNPPLYEILLHYWIKIFGISEFAVRFPSLIFSTLTVYFIYKIGKEFFSYRVAVIASLLFTFSNYHILYAHEARVYALFALLTAMSTFWFFKICKQNTRTKYYVGLLITNTALLYSHYFGFFVIIIQLISYLAIHINTKLLLKKYALYVAALFVFNLPILYNLFTRFFVTVNTGTWVSPPSGIGDLYIMLWKFSNMPLATVVSLTLIVAALIKLLVKRDFNNISIYKKVVCLGFWVPFVFMFSVSYFLPVFLDRYLIFLTIGYYLFLAICSDYLISNKRYSFIAPAVLIVCFILTFNPNMDNKRHVKEAVAKISELKDESTMVIMCPGHFVLNFAYYYNKAIFKDYDSRFVYSRMFSNLNADNVFAVNNINEVDPGNLKKASRILYLDAAGQFSFPDNNILSSLEKNHKLNNTYHFYEIFNIYEFEALEKKPER